MTKKSLKKQRLSKFNTFRTKYITHPKLIAVLLLLLALPLTSFVYNKYKDWDNAQMIKGIARDFPLLIEEVEKATGLNLEIKKNCMTTSEKFSSGVRTCELSIAKAAEQERIDEVVAVVMESSKFSQLEHNKKSESYRIGYRGKKSCTLSGRDTIYLSCIIGVRDANIQLARDTF